MATKRMITAADLDALIDCGEYASSQISHSKDAREELAERCSKVAAALKETVAFRLAPQYLALAEELRSSEPEDSWNETYEFITTQAWDHAEILPMDYSYDYNKLS